MDPYLKETKEKNKLMDKIVKIQNVLINIQIILVFILVCLLILKNNFILNLFCLIPMILISIICTILTEKARKLRNEISYEIVHRSIEAAELISKKKLNSYIIAINDKTDENLEKIKEMFQS